MLTHTHLTDAEQRVQAIRGQAADVTWYRAALARLVARGANPDQAQLSARFAVERHKDTEAPASELLGDPYTWADRTAEEWEATGSRYLDQRIDHHAWGLVSVVTGVITLLLVLLFGLSFLPSASPSAEFVEFALALSWVFCLGVLTVVGAAAVFRRSGFLPSLGTGMVVMVLWFFALRGFEAFARDSLILLLGVSVVVFAVLGIFARGRVNRNRGRIDPAEQIEDESVWEHLLRGYLLTKKVDAPRIDRFVAEARDLARGADQPLHASLGHPYVYAAHLMRAHSIPRYWAVVQQLLVLWYMVLMMATRILEDGLAGALASSFGFVLIAALYGWGAYRSFKPKGDSAGILR